ncbi:MAG: ectonucleotide pyrophosphatase/phosphodiesterase [Ignavibacteria bacterium]
MNKFLSRTLAVALLLFISARPVLSQGNTYVLLISYDAFRWDYSGRGITPNLDKIKAGGVSALSLRPTFPTKTFPNHISIITGMYPEHHGIVHNSFTNPVTDDHYRTSNKKAITNGKWYLGESFWETAEHHGIRTASYFWPGSELTDSARRPSFTMPFEQNKPYIDRIDAVINWLKMPYKDRPHFISLYINATDDVGHSYGPDSPEINSAICLEDSLTGILFGRLKEINMHDSINVIILSDHGMTAVSKDKAIFIEDIIGPNYKIEGEGPVMMIEPPADKLQDVYIKLKQKENHYKVYTRDNIPPHYFFNDNPFIYPVIIIADKGWLLTKNRTFFNDKEYLYLGEHGYDNNELDMHGIFLAAGPAFKSGYKTGSLWNIDIYPLLCKIFGIVPRQNIDGEIERIGFILK